MGAFDRDGYTTLGLPPGTPGPANGSLFAGTAAKPYPNAVLDILVSAVGRQNSRTTYDTKGLSSPDVLLDGVPLASGNRSATAAAVHTPCTHQYEQPCLKTGGRSLFAMGWRARKYMVRQMSLAIWALSIK